MTLANFKTLVGDKYALLFDMSGEIIGGRVVKYDKTVITENEYLKLKPKLEINGYILTQSLLGRVILSNSMLKEERRKQKKLVKEFDTIF